MRYLMGSSYFFSKYEDFVPKDTDYVELTDDESIKGLMVLRGKGEDIFIFRQKPKDEMIKDALKNVNLGMVVGKFLIPEFCKAIGFTVEDLPKLSILIDNLDDKHRYEQIIYTAYIVNQSFTLTQEQRDKAYEAYKDSRRYVRS